MLFDLTSDDNADDYSYYSITEAPHDPVRGSSRKGARGHKKAASKAPKTFEEFYDWLRATSSKKKLSVSADNAGVPDERLVEILPTCIVCSTRKVDVRMIVRSCLKSYYPCTGHSCKCVDEEEEGNKGSESDEDDDNNGRAVEDKKGSEPETESGHRPLKVRFYPCCSMCLAHVLWESSNEYMRSQKRYRGKCPFCKAAFCAEDLLLIDGVD